MPEIARQMLQETRVDVILGGGEDEFLPESENGCYPEPGEQEDGSNLIAEAQDAGYAYVCTADQLALVNPSITNKLLGLFADEGMERPFSPSLAAMTQVAINILSKNPEGFFLMVEGGQIDWAGHDNKAMESMESTIGFDAAVAVGQAYAAVQPNTLIIVTADHETGGMSVLPEPSGAVPEDGPFSMPDGTPFYVNWTSKEHTDLDVPVTAQGPWSELLFGRYQNTRIFEAMYAALMGETP
jgi:alkaline phosphatase